MREAALAVASMQSTLRSTPDAASISAKIQWVSFFQLVRIARPGGVLASDARKGARLRLDVWVEVGGRLASATEDVARRVSDGEQIRAIALRVLERARERIGAREPAPGRHRVVLGPGVGGVLVHELVGHRLEGDRLVSGGFSVSGGGEEFPSDLLVVDDPGRGRASWRIDDEGEEAASAVLVEGGKAVGCLTDRSTAGRLGVRGNGHGRRSSFREPVRPRMGCTFVEAGTLDAREVMDAAGSGIYVRRMETGHTDVASGTALFRVTDADRLEHGRPVEPLQPFLMTVSMLDFVRGVSHIARDVAFDTCVGTCLRDGQPLATSVGAPTFCIGMATVYR
jgi:TldD protein